MEIRQLQHFVAVASEEHFTRAAQRLNIVQSALSASVRALEEELGIKLFIRSTRQVRLTAAGRLFLEKAEAVLDAAGEARGAIEAIKGLRRGRLGVGTVQSLPAFLDLPQLLARFRSLHPQVAIKLCQGSADHLLEKVRGGRLDLAFLPMCETPPNIATRLIACEALVLVCAHEHPLAGHTAVPLGDLAGEPFVDFVADWGTRKLIDNAFFEAGVERHTAFEVSDLDTLLGLVANGLGVALIPEAIALARSSQLGLGLARLAGPEICWELVVAYLAEERSGELPLEAACREFLSLLPDAGDDDPVVADAAE
ncbi:LysR family transcriptional regulator [Radicibacter daui]|uniref:LysR family transcriptional regulator n=1 Tax=Radicibacter daui TaxID=3064829 RepID=UPI004046EA04